MAGKPMESFKRISWKAREKEANYNHTASLEGEGRRGKGKGEGKRLFDRGERNVAVRRIEEEYGAKAKREGG